VQEGTLRLSGAHHGPEVVGGELKAAVSYDTPYAVRQHEEMDYQHSAGKTSKYLELPLVASRQTGPALIAREIRKGLA
jgi:hypothetical protein